MLFEIPRSLFYRVEPLLVHLPYHYAHAGAVCTGIIPGTILVDSDVTPTHAVILPDDGFCYCISLDNDVTFLQECNEYFFMQKKVDVLEVIVSCQTLADNIAILFGGRENFSIPRKLYTLDFSVFSRSTVSNIPEVTYNITSGDSRVTIEMIYNHQNAGVCSALIYNRHAEIDISIHEEYRQKGWGTCLAYVATKYCVEHNIIPDWTCWDEKESSKRIAEKLGYALDSQFSVFIFEK